jgi:hypothetical protein
MHLILKGDKNKEQIFQIMTLMIRTKKIVKDGQIEVSTYRVLDTK